MITIHANTTATKGKVRVTFELPASHDYDGVYLVGQFDKRNETLQQMERAPSGGWSLTLELDAGCELRYGYCTLDGRWLQDAPPASANFAFDSSFLVSNAGVV